MFDLADTASLNEADKMKGLAIAGGILLLGGALELYTTLVNRYRSYKCRDWPRVQGIVIGHATRRPLLSGFSRVVPLVRYRYRVGDQDYESDAVMFGGHAPVSNEEAQAALRRYPIESEIQVIVDPNNPRLCALEDTAIGGKGLINGATMAASGIVLLAAALLAT